MMFIVLAVIVVPIVLVLLWVAGAYNGLIRLKNQVENAWACGG